MTYGLKITILGSALVAASLNILQFSANASQAAQAAALPDQTAPVRQTTAVRAAPLAATPTPSPVTTAAAPPVNPAPAPSDPVAAAQAKLAAAGLKPAFAASYLSVQAQTGTPWQLLAAVHAAETGQSGDTARRSAAGATGPLQFMPATFAHYAMDGDGNGTKDITSYNDAILTAGHYLAAGGADKGRYTTALYNYNHSSSYVSRVLTTARRLGL